MMKKKKKFVEAASSTFLYMIIIYKYHIKTNKLQIKYITNGKEVNAVENVSTYAHTHKLTSCWSVFKNWSYVDSLGLNACKWVALRTGMNLFLWYGLVLFRLDETTNRIDIYIHKYLSIYNKTLVIMKWFHLTCCEKESIYIYSLVYAYIYNEAFRLILSVAFLYLED